MIYSRQKRELVVSENRSSEAESCTFIGKQCSSIHRSSKYTKRVHGPLQGNPGTWEGRELQCAWCERRGEPPATFIADGIFSPSIFLCTQRVHPERHRQPCLCHTWLCITISALFLESSGTSSRPQQCQGCGSNEIDKRQAAVLNVGDGHSWF